MISRPVHGVIPKSMERTGKKMKEMNAANVSEMMNYVADQMIGKMICCVRSTEKPETGITVWGSSGDLRR